MCRACFRFAIVVLLLSPVAVVAQTLPVPDAKAIKNAPVGVLIRDSELFVAPDGDSSKIQTVYQGHEVAILETSKNWIRVFANTDIEQSPDEVEIFGIDARVAPASGWILDKGVIHKGQPKGDVILFGAAVSAESDASSGHGSKRAAQDARLLYRHIAEYFPDSPLAAEAAWRAADIRWQLERADSQSRPSAHEKENYLRGQMNDEEMRKIEKKYPNTKYADLAAWDMIQNKICGDWQGSVKCPLKEAEMYEKYTSEHPNSPRAAQSLYEAAWRMAAAGDMYSGEGDHAKADAARAKSTDLGTQVATRYPQSDYAARATTLIYKVQQSIPIYGSDRD
jgi:hypothetical protein